MGHLGEFGLEAPTPPPVGGKVVVCSDRGVEMATVVAVLGESDSPGCLARSRLESYLQACGPEHAYHRGGRVLRLANPQDLIDQRHLESSCKQEVAYCRQLIRQSQLPMKLCAAEHLLGGERIIFYFTAEARVDFRELVRQLAGQYRTRIEMRQVGARDEARLVADYERCGQRCCCQGFMKALKPVSMRMAKTQKATLDPTKISGRCGRLMCCLRFEDAGYEELRRLLPRRNTFVRTESVIGKVMDTQILTQLVRLLLSDHSLAVVANEDIVERDLPMPESFHLAPPPEPFDRRRILKPVVQVPQKLADLADRYVPEPAEAKEAPQAEPAVPADTEPPQPPEAAQAVPAEPGLTMKKSRRHRRSRRSRGLLREAAAAPGGSAGLSAPPVVQRQASRPAGGLEPPGRRRRRRRHDKFRGPQANPPNAGT
jgi:cell fate regulator YaaT (PSP1 superfamily)